MKTTKPICLSLLVVTAPFLGARGQELRTDINPALLYYRAFLAAPEPMWKRVKVSRNIETASVSEEE